MSHSPEPWCQPYGYEFEVYSKDGPVCETFPQSDANARRIVACVNACEGIPTGELEKTNLKERIDDLEGELYSAVETRDFQTADG